MTPCSVLVAVTFLLTSCGVLGHPGHSVAEERASRLKYLSLKPRSVRTCSTQLNVHAAQAQRRRRDLAQELRARRLTVERRDFAAYNFSHETSGVSFGDDETTIFADNSSCTLQSEVTQGPYYVDGELIRGNITETQDGVPLFLDVQLINTATCKPLPAVFVDFWHCNATGVYSGVSASGNGNSNDTTNFDATFLRGVQQTDVHGVVQIETIVPGHYTGRAPHIHVLTHNTNSTIVRSNSTLLSSAGNFSTYASHVGQLFFDQSLLTEVGKLEPYASNTQTLTTNADDSILSTEADTTDPFVRYTMLTDDIQDGILAWISIGIDPTKDQDISSAGTYYKGGGVANSNSVMGGAPGGANGTMGSGNMTAPPA